MKKKFIFVFAMMLFCCCSIFAQSGDGFIEIKHDKNTTLVRRMVCNTPQVQMPVSDLAPGNYYLRLVVEGQVIEIEQIIIN